MGIGIDAAALKAAIDTMDAAELAELRNSLSTVTSEIYVRQQHLREVEMEKKRVQRAAELLPAASMAWMGERVRINHYGYRTLQNKIGVVERIEFDRQGSPIVCVLVEGKKRKSPKYLCTEGGLIQFPLNDQLKNPHLEVINAT